jgi:signal transduction histidine kinase
MTEHTEDYVERECIELIFRQSFSGALANLAVALLLAGLLAGEVSNALLGAWVVVMLGIAVVRVAWGRAYRARLGDPVAARQWCRVYLLLLGMLGATWGIGAAVFFHQVDSVSQFTLFLVLGGLAVATVPFMAPVYACYFLYTAGVLVPLAVSVLYQADTTSVTLATMLCVFTVALMITAHIYRRKLTEAFALAYENATLVTELREYRQQLEEKVAERTQALQEANREMEAFNYTVSHDLRAPLRAIDGYSAILLEEYGPNFDTQGRDLVDRVRAASQRMGKLIDALLLLSRLSRRSLDWAGVDISELAAGIVRQLNEAHAERSVEVEVTPGMLAQADKQLLSVVLHNLLSNAWKYTRPVEQPRIEVGRRREAGKTVFFVKRQWRRVRHGLRGKTVRCVSMAAQRKRVRGCRHRTGDRGPCCTHARRQRMGTIAGRSGCDLLFYAGRTHRGRHCPGPPARQQLTTQPLGWSPKEFAAV